MGSPSNSPVSVCIPTCNRAKLLREAIESVLSQTFTDFELIVSDNASSDDTQSVARSFRDPRIRYFSHKVNIGPVGNFNHCLSLAKGAYITLFHDDDRMLPENLQRKVRALEEHPRAGLVHSAFQVIDGHGNVMERPNSPGKPAALDTVETGRDFLVRSLLRGNTVNPPSVMLRRECYSRLGGFTDKVAFTTDYEYWMRIALDYDVIFLATPLLQYREHADWGTSRYMLRVNDSMLPTLRAVEEEFLARQIILRRSRGRLQDWHRIRNLVHTREVQQLDELLYQPSEEQFSDPAERKALIRICGRQPWLIRTKPVVKFLLKQYGGDRTFNAVKNLAGHRGRARHA
jgi:glycosyltransferase involved in cell wall biosynthesis